jgi:WD40 repeat protein
VTKTSAKSRHRRRRQTEEVGGLPLVDLGQYARGEEIARGGMGRIIEATDRRLERTVAIKVLADDCAHLEARFLREARITARLQHPAIVPIYEAGRWPSGEPFYAMKLVAGRTLKEAISDAETLNERLSLLPALITVAEAIAYAHSHGVIHRDIKPSNVVLGEFGETVVIDWGLAREIDMLDTDDVNGLPYRIPGDVMLTGDGAVVGTPAYMPPEQASGVHVDRSADVYTLGATLYHLLSGGAPRRGDDPNAIVDSVVSEPPPPVEKLAPDAPPDLIAIVNKAMSHEPGDRYQNARELANELHRYETGQLVGAHSYSLVDLARRWLRRHRPLVAVAGLAMLAVTAVSIMGIARIIHERDRADEARLVAERQSREAEGARAAAEERADALIIARARDLVLTDPAAALEALVGLSVGSPSWSAARVVIADAERRGLPLVLEGHTSDVRETAFWPDGNTIASRSLEAVHVWDLETRTYVRHSISERAAVSATVSYAISLEGTSASRLDITTGDVLDLGAVDSAGQAVSKNLRGAAISDDGQRVVVWNELGVWWKDVSASAWTELGGGGAVRVQLVQMGHGALLWRRDPIDRASSVSHVALETGAEHRIADSFGFGRSFALSPDEQSLAYVRGGVLYAVALGGGTPTRLADAWPGSSYVVWSADGARIAAMPMSPNSDGQLMLIDVESGDVSVLLHDAGIRAATFSPDSAVLATATRDNQIRVWSVENIGDATELARFSLPRQARVLFFDVDGKRVGAVGDDRTIRVWSLDRHGDRMSFGGNWLGHAAWSPDGQIATMTAGNQLVLGEVGGRERLLGASMFDRRDDFSGLPRIAFDPGGAFAYTTTPGTDRIRRWSLADGTVTTIGHHAGVAWDVRSSRDGRYVAVASKVIDTAEEAGEESLLDSLSIWLWDTRTERARLLRGHGSKVEHVRFLPDNQRLVSIDREGVMLLWDLETGDAVELLSQRGIHCLAVSVQGRIAWADDHSLWITDPDGMAPRQLAHRADGISDIAFSPTGALVSAWGDGYDLELWDVATGDTIVLSGHTDDIWTVGFSPDGRRVVTGADDGVARIWDLGTAEGRELGRVDGRLMMVGFSPDGRHAFAAGGTTLLIASDELPLDAASLRAHIESLTTPFVAAIR